MVVSELIHDGAFEVWNWTGKMCSMTKGYAECPAVLGLGYAAGLGQVWEITANTIIEECSVAGGQSAGVQSG